MKKMILLSSIFPLLISAVWISGNYQKKDRLIAYNVGVKNPDGKTNYEIFIMDVDGRNARNITRNADVAWTYKAYKNRLFFISDRDTCYRCFFLYETDADGSRVKKISDLQLEDSWMDIRNNGKEMVVSGRSGNALRTQLFIIDLAGGTYRQLTSDTAARFLDPAFSPDGKQVVFSYKKNKRDRQVSEELYLMSVEGGEMKRLTHYPENNVSLNEPGYKAGAPRWHPSGGYITYISRQDGRHNIFAVNPDGTQQRRLTENGFSEGWHDWSSDGEWLVFDRSSADESGSDIVLMNMRTKQVRQLTDTTYKIQYAPVFLER